LEVHFAGVSVLAHISDADCAIGIDRDGADETFDRPIR
jgi:hypothetical protein